MTTRTQFIAELHADRRVHGPYSPIGSRCSQLEQVTSNIDKPHFAHVRPKLIAQAEAFALEIHAIKHGAPATTQIRPRDHQ
ncbi:hypothetical protein AB8B21_05945 [Tardiphaga sp. 866_E4_N2_1]|uniref:hypothetical protein n=1 Tax=unclassified Tardiphaga TaxID=2631404 RepID=UPI003F27D7E4